ncbi:hypothetical protein RB608_25315 [Nocardioides sp. LHD-245]|uniref:hypothetical protein n=1 Tax=Nocardioides sp. LHD-245 TaxID=3051387 RepID=UPI0027E0C444|nr:hypothetical protein [Nocardioides sp. LHD-245]
MGTVLKILVGLLLTGALTACGDDPEADLRSQVNDLGLGDEIADCIITELRDEAGSLDALSELSLSEQRKAAARAGAACGKKTSPEELRAAMEKGDFDVFDDRARTALLEVMMSRGVPKKKARCVVDRAMEQGLKPTDLLDQPTMQEIVAFCQ